MPTIAQLVQKNQERISAQGGESEVAPVAPQTPAVLPAPPPQVPALPNRGPFPSFGTSKSQLDTDITGYAAVFQKNTVRSRAYPVPPVTNTQKTTIVQQASSVAASLKLQTNNVDNPNQSLLNLQQGPNVSIVTTAGGTLISATGGNDGIDHGELPWESDPAYVIMRDDFISVVANNLTTPFISEMPWSYVSSSSAGGAAPISAGFPQLGSIGWNNNGTASNISAMSPFNNVSTYVPTFAWPVFDYPNWKMVWVFQLDKPSLGSDPTWSWEKVSFYLGLANWNPNLGLSTTAVPRTPFGCWLRYDTDTTSPSIGDTEFVFECVTHVVSNATVTRTVANVQGNTQATGITAQEHHVYRFEIECTIAGSVTMTLVDGTAGTTFTSTLTVPKWTLNGTGHTSETYTSASNRVQINFENSSGGLIAAPFGPGSQIAISGIVASGYTGLNGTWDCVGNTNSGSGSSIANTIWYGSTLPASGTTIGGNYSGYPAMVPYFAFGNDSEASPTAGSKGVLIDFFSFVWNPGVGNGGTANPLKARYF